MKTTTSLASNTAIMVRKLPTETTPAIIYPDFDGQPMADNTNNFAGLW